MGTQPTPTEEDIFNTRKLMPPIFPVKNREIPRDPVTTSTAATTLTESMMSMIMSAITTTVPTVSTVEDITESTSEDVTSEEVTESTSEEATMATTATMTASTVSTDMTVTTVSTVVEEINLEDDDSDTDSFNPGEIPAVLDSDLDDYEDWMPLLQNSSVKKNSR